MLGFWEIIFQRSKWKLSSQAGPGDSRPNLKPSGPKFRPQPPEDEAYLPDEFVLERDQNLGEEPIRFAGEPRNGYGPVKVLLVANEIGNTS